MLAFNKSGGKKRTKTGKQKKSQKFKKALDKKNIPV
jgi:hypothetical protein